MRLFDVHQFELSEKEVIDWDKTKSEIGSMLSSYLVSRERMGLTRMPPIHSTYSLLDQDIPEIKHSSFVQENQQFKQEFLYFHHLFSLGLTATSHPYKPEITDRSCVSNTVSEGAVVVAGATEGTSISLGFRHKKNAKSLDKYRFLA